jgi:pyruvate formate lyase activating enzyme
MTTGVIFDIHRFALHDGPGIRTVVFLKGCGLRCWWCHNPESQHPKPELMLHPARCIHCVRCFDVCPQGAISEAGTDWARCTACGMCAAVCYAEAREIVGREVTVEAVIAAITRDTAFYDESGGGVTFSGGEPLLQGDFLLALLKACKERDLHTALDTCGYAPTETLNRVREVVDLFLYDLKAMDDTRHREVTGVSNKLILENLRLLNAHGHRVILRVPLIPGVNDDDETIREIGALARSLACVERVDVLPYHRIGIDKYGQLRTSHPLSTRGNGEKSAIGRGREFEPPTEARVNEIRDRLQADGLQVKIGG